MEIPKFFPIVGKILSLLPGRGGGEGRKRSASEF